MGDQEEIIINRRRTWLKLCMRSGFQIIPVYALGNNQTYTRCVGQNSCLARISKKYKMSLLPFYGRFGIMPWRNKKVVALGNIIEVEQKENPTEEDVDVLHEKFKNEIFRIYYKGNFHTIHKVNGKTFASLE